MAYRTLAYDAATDEARRLAALTAASGVARLEVLASCERDALVRALSVDGADIVVLGLRTGAGATDELALARRCLRTGGHAQVVYVGAREAFASEVYETPHVGFVLRPVDRRELDAALARAVERLEGWRSRPVLVRTTAGDERAIRPRAVSHVESSRKLLRIHVGGEVVEAYGKKSDLADLLPENFVQCHRSHLVNLGCVDTFGKYSVKLSTGEVVPVSRERMESMREAYRSYVGRVL